MTPAEMSALHHAAFASERGWTAAEFADLLGSPHVTAVIQPHGFALVRTLAGESELLTLVVNPAQHRHGIGRALMRDWLSAIATTAETAFLEVAADNSAARALYAKFGFETTATRRGYYPRTDGLAVDALLMKRAITHGPPSESPPA